MCELEIGEIGRAREEREEAVKCIDFFFLPPSFLELIKVLAWFSDYPTAYRGFLHLWGSEYYLSSPPLIRL